MPYQQVYYTRRTRHNPPQHLARCHGCDGRTRPMLGIVNQTPKCAKWDPLFIDDSIRGSSTQGNLTSVSLQDALIASPEEIFPVINPPDECLEKTPLTYQYTQLPSETSIRLLKVHTLPEAGPRKLRDPLRCSIMVADLEDHPEYSALSYTWGDPRAIFPSEDDIFPRETWAAPAFEIECEGSPISVATNLYTALVSLREGLSSSGGTWAPVLGDYRYRFQPQNDGDYFYLWVDALCINQSDLDEKGRQIPLMGRVYSQAQTTWMWLGGGEPLITQGAPTSWGKLEQVVERLETRLIIDGSLMEEQAFLKRLETFDVYDPAAYMDIGLEPIKPTDLIGLYLLFSRNWFKRAWTYQEWVLSPCCVFICGSVVLSSQKLFDILQITRGRWLARIQDLVRAHIVEPECNDTQNNYLSAAIRKPEVPPLFCPNYDHRLRGNVGILHVVQSVKAILGHGSSFLKGDDHVHQLPPQGARKPSLWSMNDLRSLEATNPRDHIFAFYTIFKECAARSRSASFPTPDYTKAVRDVYIEAAGLMVAEVGLALLCVREPRSDEDDGNSLGLPSWVPNFGCWFVPMLDGGGAEVSGSKWYRADSGLGSSTSTLEVQSGHLLDVHGYRIDTVIRFNKMGMNTRQESSKRFQDLVAILGAAESPQTTTQDWFEAPWQALVANQCSTGDSDEPDGLMAERLSPSHPGINLCATAVGRLGITQAELTPGDEIWILAGSPVPVALRGVGGRCYEVVGCMYVHGIMHGEGLLASTERLYIDLV